MKGGYRMNKKQRFWSLLNKQAFFPPAIILTLAVLLGAFFPAQFNAAGNAALAWITEELGWLFTIGSIILFIFCLWAGFSKYGKIKLGGPKAKPAMSTFQWFAVSFTSSLAIGVSYWCVAEPMTYFMQPPTFTGAEGGTIEAAVLAMRYAYHHWAFVPFAIYTSAGVAVAFLFYNCGKAFRVSSSLIPLFGEKANGTLGNLVDAICIFAMVGGIGTSLGLGAMQIAGGMEYVFGIDSNIAILTVIIVVMAIIYTVVATTGIHNGIKHVGTFNMYLYFILMFFVLLLGPTRHIIENIITASGDYLANFIPLLTNLDPIAQTGWHESWTIFYWAWWLAFAPLTGLFMVKLAKGRTIREFVLVNMIAPATFILIWFGTFGTAGIFSDMFENTNIGQRIMEFGSEIAVFELLSHYPFATATCILTIVLVALSFNTQAEAVAYTLAAMTTVGFDKSGNEKDPPKTVIVFWSLLMAAITIVLLYTGGETSMLALQTSVVVCALPIIFLQVLMAYSYFKCMKQCKKYDIVGTFDDPQYQDIIKEQTNINAETVQQQTKEEERI